MTGPLRIIVLGPIPEVVREALGRLPGGSILVDHPDPDGAVGALAAGDASLAVLAALDPAGDTFRGLLAREFARADRYGHALTLVRLAVDGLDELEQRFGRESVSAFLASLEETLRRSLRRVDMLVRAGHGEFAALLPETSPSGGAVAAERLRDLAARLMGKPPVGDTKPVLPFRATASVGIACFPSPGIENAQAFHLAAGHALAEAKRSGGNRVCAAGSSPA